MEGIYKNLDCKILYRADLEPGCVYFCKGYVYSLLAFRKAVEGLVRVDSQEMRAVVDREVAKQENVHQQIIKEYQGR